MKKLYLLSSLLIGLLLIQFNNAYNQEMLVGGNMENADSWKTSKLNQDADNSVDYTFNYTDDGPTAGSGGCLYLSGTNTGAANGNLTNFMFYQQVTLERGANYNFTGAYKDNRTNNYWCEVYVGGNEPAEGADYAADQGAVLIYGFKSTNWEAGCPSDVFDGTFQDDACTPGSTNGVVTFEGTGDTTVFVGFRMGIWDDGSNGYNFEAWVDNISLMKAGGGGTSIDIPSGEISVYPNPVSSTTSITLNSRINNLEVINLYGQTVYTRTSVNQTSVNLDLSAESEGLYFLRVTDETGKSGMIKIVKTK